jgi:hypothetical protein
MSLSTMSIVNDVLLLPVARCAQADGDIIPVMFRFISGDDRRQNSSRVLDGIVHFVYYRYALTVVMASRHYEAEKRSHIFGACGAHW